MKRRDFMAAAGLAGTVNVAPSASPSQAGVSWLTRERYRGLFAYPPTPFAPDLTLDEEALRSNFKKLIRVGVDGIVVAGSTGEFYTLTDSEHRRIGEILREETRGTGVIGVLGATGLNTREVIRRVSAAMEVGLDAVLAMQPFYVPLTRKELLAFWGEVSKACPNIGIIIYHYDWVRQEYTSDIYRALAKHPNIVGSKEGHFDFRKWRSFQSDSPLVHMSATDMGWLVEMYKLGAPGLGSVSFSLMPHLIQKVLRLCGEGKYDEAERAYAPYTEGVGRLRSGAGRPYLFPSELSGWREYGGAARGKALVDAFGFLKAGPPRPPAIPLPADLQKQMKDYLLAHCPELIPPPNFAESVPAGTKLWVRRKAPETHPG